MSRRWLHEQADAGWRTIAATPALLLYVFAAGLSARCDGTQRFGLRVFSFVCPALGMSESSEQRRVVLRCRDLPGGAVLLNTSGCILA